MTKLQEFVAGILAFVVVWISLLSIETESKVYEEWKKSLIYLPIQLILLFGLYSVATIMVRVYALKDCTEAAKELQNEIEEAKADLKSKGLEI